MNLVYFICAVLCFCLAYVFLLPQLLRSSHVMCHISNELICSSLNAAHNDNNKLTHFDKPNGCFDAAGTIHAAPFQLERCAFIYIFRKCIIDIWISTTYVALSVIYARFRSLVIVSSCYRTPHKDAQTVLVPFLIWRVRANNQMKCMNE